MEYKQWCQLITKIYTMELNRGDNILITFKDGQKVACKVTALHYRDEDRYNNQRLHYFHIDYKKEDGQEYWADLERIEDVQLVVRNKRAKKLLTADMKLLNHRIDMGYFITSGGK